MPKWFYSLQFRLVLGFASALALALTGVAAYVSFQADQETQALQEELQQARMTRVQHMLARHYAIGRQWQGVKRALDQASRLYGWRIVLNNPEGIIVADSHSELDPRRDPVERDRQVRQVHIESEGQRVGTVLIAPRSIPQDPPEPPISRLASKTNRALLLTGLGTGIGGVLLVSFTAGRLLSPIRTLNRATRRLGQGDLTQRVPLTGGRDEVSELGRTFNSMAEALEAAQAQRQQLMADIAHELRTPLSNVQGYLEAVRDGLLEPDERTVSSIYGQVLQLTNLIEDLRVLALADAGALPLNPEPNELGSLVRSSVNAILPRAGARGVEVTMEQNEMPWHVRADATRLRQIVGNLLDNAVAHTPAGGQVQVRIQSKSDQHVRITVADTGEGIPEEQLSRVFDRFYRVDTSRSRQTGGAGLGLAIAKELVEVHGGRIWAESQVGNGTRFHVELPLHTAVTSIA